MDWLQVAISGVVAAVAGGLAMFFTQGSENSRRRAVVVILALLVSQAVVQGAIAPQFKARRDIRTLEAEMDKQELFRVIKRYESGLYAEMLFRMKKDIENGAGVQAVLTTGRSYVVKILSKRLPGASNASVASYLQVMIKELSILESRDPNLCYQFLFPTQASGTLDLQKYISKDVRDEDLAALAQVIKTSVEEGNAVPLDGEVRPLLEGVVLQLAREYGRDVAQLSNPYAGGVSHAKMCQMTNAFYRNLLRLPAEDSGRIMRYLAAQAPQPK